MSVVERKNKRGKTYYVTFRWQGRQVWERAGNDRRSADRLDRKRKAEVAAGTYHPDPGAAPGLSVRQYAAGWLERRKTRTAKDDARWLRLHVLPREWLARLLMDDVRPTHIQRLVEQLKTEGKLSEKSIGNVVGVLHVMFAEAHRAEHVTQNPVDLPRGTIKKTPQHERGTYTVPEVVVLTRNEAIPDGVRVLLAMCLLGGMREGEACGRRWRDLDVEARPLWCLSVKTQYDDRPLKTNRTRSVPVHPELAAMLERWARAGFEILTCRRPTPDDFIVPNVSSRARVPCHTKSTLYKAFQRACKDTGIVAHSLHATRHTFITMARRAGAPRDLVERITHNARGTIVDQYTHWEWAPLCEAVERIRLEVDEHQRLQSGGGNPGKRSGPDSLLDAANYRELPEDTDSRPGSIPGASTQRQEKNRGLRKRSNIRSNSPTLVERRRKVGLLALLDPDAAALEAAFLDGVDAAFAGDPVAQAASLRKAATALGYLCADGTRAGGGR